MPLGEIHPRVVTPTEARWRLRWEKYEGRDIRELYPEFRHMTQGEFMAYLYTMDPRSALLLANWAAFRAIMDYQRTKRWYHEVLDALWRGYAHVFGK